MPLVILDHLLNVSLQLANNWGFKQKKNNRRIVGRAVFFVVRVLSKENKRLIFPEFLFSYSIPIILFDAA
jgi:hypothetical protein